MIMMKLQSDPVSSPSQCSCPGNAHSLVTTLPGKIDGTIQNGKHCYQHFNLFLILIFSIFAMSKSEGNT